MTQASIAKTAEFTALNEAESGEEIEEISSEFSISANDSTTRGTSGKNMAAKKVGNEKSSSAKSKESSSSSRRTAKMTDLKSLESKLVGEMNTRFESLDGKFARLFEVLDSNKTDSVQRGSNSPRNMDSGTLGARRPPTETLANPDTAREEMAIDNRCNLDFGMERHDFPDNQSVLSLQPGQVERQNIGLLDSDGSEKNSVIVELETETNRRFGKYTGTEYRLNQNNVTTGDTNNQPLTHDLLKEMFGEDAQIDNQNNRGLTLDNAQIEIINTSWRSQAPDKMTAYKDSYRQSFPIHESAEALLQVPSLDELTERLLIKRHGRRAAYGSSQSLFSQPFKSIEKIAYQGQVASRMGLISVCYLQQALGLLLKNLKSESPNLDEAVQNVRDLFAISTKTLDQFARAGAFMHLVRRKATVADTGLHDFKDLQKAALTSPLSGEGIFGPDFEKKLKDRQEKDKQLSELMPEMNKKQFMKRKSNFQAESNAKKARNNYDSYRSFRNNSSGSSSSFRRSFKQGSHSANFKNNGKSVVSSFRSQGNRSNKA